MGFSDNPQIDDFSKISEESVLATKQAFLQRKGFLVREESPDKGVDLDVELLVDNQVSGFKFAIQIKSSQDVKTGKRSGIKCIKYTIKTSRLGYLCRRKPGMGLIVVYDERNEKLYYDYVEKICARITKDHKDNTWVNQDTVVFTIPFQNTVNDNAVANIYKTMRQRNDRFTDMYETAASDYDLPIFNFGTPTNPTTILDEYGYLFFNKKEYQILYGLFSKMSLDKILGNPKFTLLAAITYYETGRHAEATFFLKKSELYIGQYTSSERELQNVTSINLEYSLGRLEVEEYEKRLRKLDATITGGMNRVFVKLQIMRMKMLQVDIFEETSNSNFFHDIEEITSTIKNINEDEDIGSLYLIEVASFIHELGVQRFLKTTARMTIRRTMLGDDAVDEETMRDLKFIIGLTINSHALLQGIIELSNTTNNEYLNAVALYKKNYMFYSLLFQTTVSSLSANRPIDEFKSADSGKQMKIAYYELIESYNLFQRRDIAGGAYNTLGIARELNFLYSFFNGKNIDDDVHTQTEAALLQLEKVLQIPPSKIMSEELLVKILERKKVPTASTYKTMSVEEREKFALYSVKSAGLPPERAANVLAEIEFMAKAADAINDNYFEVLQNLKHTKNMETMYKDHPKFVIHCKGCGYQTLESTSLDELLRCLKTQHPHYCLNNIS